MTLFQKIAALIFRITALGLAFYSLFAAYLTRAVMGGVFWSEVLVFFVTGVALFLAAIPLARLATIGLQE